MLIGHKKQWDFLKKKIQSDQLSHAYLFRGPDGVGKKRFALDFVKSINCIDEKECKLIEEGKHPDVLIVKPKEDKSEIEISQVREVQQFLALKPYYGSFKAVIIDEAEKMNQQAQSCFLKTLEEPKGKTILILISSRPEMLLSTILSRCQTISFFIVALKEIKNYLMENGVQEKRAEMIASMSDNRPGRAIDFLLQPDKIEKENKSLKEVLEVCNSDLALKFKYVKNLQENSFGETIDIIKKYFRQLLFFKMGVNNFMELGYFPLPPEKLKSYSFAKLKEIIRLAEIIDFRLLTSNINPKLALEILLIEI